MTDRMRHFVDPTMPGLSARDLRTTLVPVGRRGAKRSDIEVRRALSRLTPRLLCDIGLDRYAA